MIYLFLYDDQTTARTDKINLLNVDDIKRFAPESLLQFNELRLNVNRVECPPSNNNRCIYRLKINHKPANAHDTYSLAVKIGLREWINEDLQINDNYELIETNGKDAAHERGHCIKNNEIRKNSANLCGLRTYDLLRKKRLMVCDVDNATYTITLRRHSQFLVI